MCVETVSSLFDFLNEIASMIVANGRCELQKKGEVECRYTCLARPTILAGLSVY